MAVGHQDHAADDGPTIPGSYEAFKVLCAEFLRAADTAGADELAAGAKCVGHAFLGIQWDDANPRHSIHRAAGAPALMRIVTKKVFERELVLEQADAGERDRCAP
jgi:hypothetical protein